MILRKISKIVANRCQILRLKCTKFDFRVGGAYSAPPDLMAVFKGTLLRGGRGWGREGKGKRRERKGREGRVDLPTWESGSASADNIRANRKWIRCY